MTNLNDITVTVAFFMLFLIFIPFMALSIFMVICKWKMFKKAGKEGWECLVPVYNTIIELEIAGLPIWYIVLLMIPFVNIYATIKMSINICRNFGKDTGFILLYIFVPVVALPLLAFGRAEYNQQY